MKARPFLVASTWGLAACGPPTVSPTEVPCPELSTSEELRDARGRLERLRGERSGEPYSREVTAEIASGAGARPFSLRARGAIAVSPGRAARLVLVGAGGVSVFDAWVTPTAYRVKAGERVFRVPNRSVASERTVSVEVPVALLREAFVRPLAGNVVFACRGEPWTIGVRDDGRVSRITAIDRGLRLATGSASLTIVRAGDEERAEYVDPTAKVRVVVTSGPRSAESPDPEAFEEPERGGASR